MSIITPVAADLNVGEVFVDDHVAKLSLVGVGMRSHAAITSKMFKALSDIGVNIQLISTSEIKVSVILDEKHIEAGVRALHSAFELEKELIED
jgi:aspartate kinase